MLSIARMSLGQEGYYDKLAREDYYLEGGEPPGHWLGEACDSLGLHGQVKSSDLKGVFSGTLGRRKLVQSGGQHARCPGWDLTFSAPKSVSTLWSQADRERARLVQECQQTAVIKALAYVEQKCGITRRGRGGHQVEPVKCLFATFEHGTSRAGQPQLHTHSLMLNLGIRADGTTGTIRSDLLYKHKMAAGAVYRAELAHQLGLKLGLQTIRDGASFRVVGVDKNLCDHFSERRREIEEALKRMGRVGAVASAQVALLTRSSKKSVPRAELQREWRKTGVGYGFSTREVAGLSIPDWKTPRDCDLLARLSVKEGITECMESNSTFTEKELVRFSAQVAQGQQIGADMVLDAVKAELGENQELLALGTLDHEAQYTTKAQYELEQGLVREVEDMLNSPALRVSEQATSRAIQRSKDPLTAEQEEAIRHILHGRGQVAAIIGDAGTGKTTILKPVREALQSSGYEVRGAALAGKAAEGMMQGAGIQSGTIKSLVHCLDHVEHGWNEQRARRDFEAWVATERQRKNRPDFNPIFSPEKSKARFKKFSQKHSMSERTVLFIDEAAMVDTRNTARVFEHAKKAGSKIVLIGDAKQLQSIEAGGAFSKIAEMVKAARLTEVFRQQNADERAAVENMAKGNVQQALTHFAEKGKLAVADDRREALDRLLGDWARTAIDNPQNHLILAGTNVDVVNLNREAQERRFSAGSLGRGRVRVGSYDIRQGDRVVFTRRDKRMGVENGSFGTVRSVSPVLGTVSVELDGESRPSKRRRTFSINSYRDLKLGYATTTHKSQGSTIGQAFVLTDEAMIDHQISYVQMSRAREETRIYTTRDQAGDDLLDIVRQMGRDRKKILALEREAQAMKQRQTTMAMKV